MSEVNLKRINVKEVFEIAGKTNVHIDGFKKGKKGTEVLVSCDNNHQYPQRLDAFKISQGCKYCNNYVKYTYKEVKEYIEQQNYKLLSEKYFHSDVPLDVECPKGHLFTPTFHNFLHNNSRCPKCNGGVVFKYDYVKKYIESKGCELLSTEYINTLTDLSIRCVNGHIYLQTFDAFKLDVSCKFCNNSSRKFTYEYVRDHICSFDYKLLNKEYINRDSLLDVECDRGHQYPVSFHNFKAGYRCPVCASSKGEKEILRVLKKYKIHYVKEHRYADCKDKYTLPFDFYIPSINLCIEYDGQQHFVPIKHFGGEKKLKQIQKRDKIKTQYCISNDIELLRIPYWDFDNIEKIVYEKLNLQIRMKNLQRLSLKKEYNVSD